MSSGSDLPGQDREQTVTFRVNRDAVARFDAALDDLGYDSRSEALRDFVERNAESRGRLEHRPSGERESEIYDALLSVSTDSLVVVPERHGAELAQQLQTQESNIEAALYPLRKRGYVSFQTSHPGSGVERTVWHLKPPCADPEEWSRREQF